MWLRRLSLARQPPWKRVEEGSVLSIDLGGAFPESAAPASPFSGPQPLTLPALTDALRKAAVDPRITGVYFKVSPVAAGWAKLGAVRAAIAQFRATTGGSKFTMAFMELATEREFYVASSCEEVYMPPSAYVSLRGLAVSATFLRGVLETAGIEPQIKRIGVYKSAGDQLGRRSMSDAQREVITSLLSQTFAEWTSKVAISRGKTVDDVQALVDAPAPALTPQQLADAGWLTGTMYSDEVKQHLAARTGGAQGEVRSVTVARYARTRPQSLGLDIGPPTIGVIRASGAISRGRSNPGLGRGSSGITNEDFIATLQRAKKDPRVKAILLRIDSPGGDALASDLMWRELRTCGKPVIASMSDVAASGGYYMAMACDTIFAEPLTLTGSIGVITGKFNLAQLYKRIGYNKETLSKGRYAEVDADNRSFTAEEEQYFDLNAWQAYTSFRDKAALSRGLTPENMEQFAQGRVWTGVQALERGLVDAVGGFDDALAAAKKAAGMKPDDAVSLVDFTRQPGGLAALMGGASAVAGAIAQAGAAFAAVRSRGASVTAAPQASMAPINVGGFAAGVGADEGFQAILTTAMAALQDSGMDAPAGDASLDPLMQ